MKLNRSILTLAAVVLTGMPTVSVLGQIEQRPALTMETGASAIISLRTVDEAGGGGDPVMLGTACAGGEIHDDGTFESGLGWQPVVTSGVFVVPFTPPTYPFRYTTVCICWSRVGAEQDIDFDIEFYDDDGPSGAPGTLLASVAVSAVGVGDAASFFTYDVLSAGVVITDGSVYIGARWDPSTEIDFFICADTTAATPLHAIWGREEPGTPDVDLTGAFGARALAIRADGLDAAAAIPTVTEWGLIVLALLMLTAGTIIIRREMVLRAA